jgi:hypothetical protein
MFCVVAIFAACTENPKTSDVAAEANTVTIEVPTIKVGEFDGIAGKYVDKEVKVKGIVDHVCRHGGKRILLVDDDSDLHIDSETRFDDELMGSEIVVTGIVREFRVDEAYCLKMEEDNIQSHKEGGDDESFEHKNEQIQFFRDSMKVAETDHLSFYSLDYVSHEELEES